MIVDCKLHGRYKVWLLIQDSHLALDACYLLVMSSFGILYIIPMRNADFRCSARSPASMSGAAQLKKQNVHVGETVSVFPEVAMIF